MPCSTCTDEARCNRAGVCQASKLKFAAALRPVHGGYPAGVMVPAWPLKPCQDMGAPRVRTVGVKGPDHA